MLLLGLYPGILKSRDTTLITTTQLKQYVILFWELEKAATWRKQNKGGSAKEELGPLLKHELGPTKTQTLHLEFLVGQIWNASVP